MEITGQSLEVFLIYARQAAHGSGTPLVSGSQEERGNLTQLKRAGLIKTFKHDGETFIEFTDEGVQLASEHGVEIV